jgi:hypothetical protein
MNTNNRVSLGFSDLSDPALDETAANIVVSLQERIASFPNLPVDPTELGTQRVAFHNGILAAASGDKQAIAARNVARETLLTSLRQNAAYVQSLTVNNLPLLLSTGYKPVSTNRTSEPLATPAILNLDNQSTTRLFMNVERVANARVYQGRLTTAQGVVVATVESTRSRQIEFPNLVPGTMYTAQARGLGGSTGASDWSLPVTIMAT